MEPFELKKNTYWVGVKDPELVIFDIVVPTQHGTTYNSYLIKGEKIALIDGVKINYSDAHFNNIKKLSDIEKIDYIIVNHTEPDHSGSIAILAEICKSATIVYSKTASFFIKNIIKGDFNGLPVGDGDKIDLGKGKLLSFIHAPFLHWPDTMFTYLEGEKILFPCDFFGSHYCSEKMFNDELEDPDVQFEAFKFYFNHIMRPFKPYSLSAIEKIRNIEIEVIAPSHGPIIRKNIKKYIDWYRERSEKKRYEYKKISIIYTSAYGNTKKMADAIIDGISEVNGVRVVMLNAGTEDQDAIIDAIEESDGVLFGSPTLNGKPPKPIFDIIANLVLLNVTGKAAGVFGCFGWSGEAVSIIEGIIKSLKFKIVEDGIKLKMIPTENDLEKCKEFGRKFATHLLPTAS